MAWMASVEKQGKLATKGREAHLAQKELSARLESLVSQAL